MTNVDSLKSIDQIVHQFNTEKGSAMIILQQVQAEYGYVSSEMVERISKLTAIPASELFGIITFYSQFRLTPVGEKLIQVCHGTACHLAGAEQISEAVVNVTGAKEGTTSDDGKFTLEHVACLGCCSHGPVMTINGETYAKMTPDKVKKLLKPKGNCHCNNARQDDASMREGCGVNE